MTSIGIFVLGDLGHSPRMQYHALSCANHLRGIEHVYFMGYQESACLQELQEHSKIEILSIAKMNKNVYYLPHLVYLVLKVMYQIIQLIYLLCVRLPRVDAILMQNPPTIPSMFVVWLICRLRGIKFIVDWHNLGYTVLSMSMGPQHVFVKMATWLERFFGQKADANFCVTKAMQHWLQENWQIHAHVLYDKPPLFFKPTNLSTQHKLFRKLTDTFKHCNHLVSCDENNFEQTLVTQIKSRKDKPTSRKDRPAILISSTSWTEDEDFGILLNALLLLEDKTKELPIHEFPNLLAVVTGKGPQKEYYLKKIANLSLRRTQIVTVWLEASDYPLLLGSADVGVCLHTSTSGLDLPMKVLDMFGCGLPVCAVDFNCLSELVQHNKNGLVFKDDIELSNQLYEILKGYPKNETLQKLRNGIGKIEHWSDMWNKVAALVLQDQIQSQ